MRTAAAGKAKAGMAHSDCGWTCRCAGKTMRSLENTCHSWALLRWCFTTKRRYIKCKHLYLTFMRLHSAIKLVNLYWLDLMKTLRRTLELGVCKYTDMKARCNETDARNYVRHYMKYLELWDTNNCGRLFCNLIVCTTYNFYFCFSTRCTTQL